MGGVYTDSTSKLLNCGSPMVGYVIATDMCEVYALKYRSCDIVLHMTICKATEVGYIYKQLIDTVVKVWVLYT